MRLCHLFALAVGALAVMAATPSPAEACWWGKGGGRGYGGGWGYGGPRYAAPAPAYYAPGPGVYAPAPGMYAPGPGVYAPGPGVYSPGLRNYAPGTAYPAQPYPAPAPGMRAMPAAPLGPSPAPAAAGTVTARDNTFDPATLNVQPGTTVRWVNNGQHPHTVTDRDGKFDSGDIRPGGSFTHTFQTAGTYRYYCKHHKGMEGTIVVGEPGKGPGAGSGASKGPSY
jgi:plastocyanin